MTQVQKCTLYLKNMKRKNLSELLDSNPQPSNPGQGKIADFLFSSISHLLV